MKTQTPRHARLLSEAASRSSVRLRPETLTRAAAAKAMALVGGSPETILADDDPASMVLRATVLPHSDADTAALSQAALSAFLIDLAPVSAAATLLTRAGVSISAGPQRINLPLLDASAAAAWVKDLDAIPVVSAGLGMATLIRRNLAAIAVVSAELMKRTTAPQVLDGLLRRAAAAALDATMFDSTAESDERPAGLLYGITPIAGYPGGDAEARKVDLAALVAAMTTVSPDFALIMHPLRALSLSLDGIDLGFPVFPSAYIPQGTIIAVALPALAVWSGGVEINTSREATIHMSDDPSEIVSDGGAVGDPTRSAWQTDTVAVRLILEAGWATQATGAVAYVTGATW